MQQITRLSPRSAVAATAAATERGVAFWSYVGALVIGASLLATTFPADFLLGIDRPARPPETDLAQHIVGQRYFLADHWRWPLLDAGNLFIPRGINIAFVDAVPLLAVLLKLLAPILPPGYHGIGLWFVVAWLLQPVAAVWCLRGAGERRLLPALAVAVAAASMPAWLDRVGHAALCGHFLLLLGLGLYIRLVGQPGPSRRLWAAAAALQLASLLIHPYLALMVLTLLGAVPLTLATRRDSRWRRAALGFVGCALAMLAAMALFGYLGATGGGGFGIYALDLLSPFWPAGSALLPFDLPRLDASGGGGGEGYNYLGFGVLLGLGVALLRVRRVKELAARHVGLAAALLALTLLAVSQRPALGGHVLLDLGSVPTWLENLRSTGRFFWPVSYAALIAVVVLAARHPKPHVGAVLVTAIAALQFADAATLRADVRERFRSPATSWRVEAPAVRALLPGHESLTLLPSWQCVPATDPVPEQRLLMDLLLLASETGLPVSTMYLARWQGELRCDDQRLAAAPLGKGELRVLTPSAQAAYLPLVPRAAELCSALGALMVCRDPAAGGPPPTDAHALTPRWAVGEVRFAAPDSGTRMLGEGWSHPEHDGSWSMANQVTLAAERPPELTGPLRLEFELEAMAPSDDRPQEVELRWGKTTIARWALPDRKRLRVAAVLPPGPPGRAELEFRLGLPTRPIDRGLGGDVRRLGVKLHRMSVARDESWPALGEGETRFGKGALGTALLGIGWSQPEDEGVWSDGEAALLGFVRSPKLAGPTRMSFELEGFGPRQGEPQTVELWHADRRLAEWELPDRRRAWFTAPLPASPPAATSLRFEVSSPARPIDRGDSRDGRSLGVRLLKLRLAPVVPVLQAGSYTFTNHGPGLWLLGDGWAEPGPAGVVAAEGRASLRFDRPAALVGPLKLTLELRELGPPGEQQPVELWLWGRRLASWSLPGAGRVRRVTTPLPAGAAEETELVLRGGGLGHVALSAACVEPMRYRRHEASCALPAASDLESPSTAAAGASS